MKKCSQLNLVMKTSHKKRHDLQFVDRLRSSSWLNERRSSTKKTWDLMSLISQKISWHFWRCLLWAVLSTSLERSWSQNFLQLLSLPRTQLLPVERRLLRDQQLQNEAPDCLFDWWAEMRQLKKSSCCSMHLHWTAYCCHDQVDDEDDHEWGSCCRCWSQLDSWIPILDSYWRSTRIKDFLVFLEQQWLF